MSSYSINQIPESERPRERLMRFGPESLSASELVAIVLGSGTKTMPVMQLAHEIVGRFGSLQGIAEATIEELCQIKGVGLTKAIQLQASFNLGMRAGRHNSVVRLRIEHPVHAYHLIKDEMQNEKREVLVAILLDVKGCLICHQIVSIGTLSSTVIHPREVFYPAIRHKASSMILVHNHPSGDLNPSKEDITATHQLMEVAKVVGIPIKDHLIVSTQGYLSMRQKGMIE